MTRRQRSAAAFAAMIVPLALAVGVALWLSRPAGLSINGDEPHYLVISDAIVRDRTLDLRTAYGRQAREPRIYNVPLRPHTIIVNHRWGPYHTPGLSILLAIPFAIGGVVAARIALCLVAIALSASVFVAARRRRPDDLAAWITIGAGVSLPIAFGASQIYPDLAAGVVATALAFWLLDREARPASAGAWAAFWIVSGLLPWLNIKFAPTAIVLASGGLATVWAATRAAGSTAARAGRNTCALVAIGPALLAVYYLWAFGTIVDPRTPHEMASSPARAAMMFLGFHFDQAQGMFFQQPLLAAGAAAFVPFARSRPRFAMWWVALYASLVVPNAFELARYGGGGPAGRFGWSAAWLWLIPLVVAIGDGDSALRRVIKPLVVACLAYQAALAFRWLPDPGVLFPNFDPRLDVRNSLFPVALRGWLPSFYLWDFASYWTYPPNVAAYVVFVALIVAGAMMRPGGATESS